MAEHLTMDKIEQYRSVNLPFAEMLSASEHLESCTECRQHLQSLLAKTGVSVVAGLGGPEEADPHLTYDLKASYIRGKLDAIERETVELHVMVCRNCAEELEQLSAFARDLSQAPVRQRSRLGWLNNYLSENKFIANAIAAVLAAAGSVIAGAALRSFSTGQGRLPSSVVLINGFLVIVIIAAAVWVLRWLAPSGTRVWGVQLAPIAAVLVVAVVAGWVFLDSNPKDQPQIAQLPHASLSASASPGTAKSATRPAPPPAATGSNTPPTELGAAQRNPARPEAAAPIAPGSASNTSLGAAGDRPTPSIGASSPGLSALQLRDGDHTVVVNGSNDVAGLDYLPQPYQHLIAAELRQDVVARSPMLIPRLPQKGFFAIEPAYEPEENNQPAFRWTNVAGATYTLHLYDTSGSEVQVAGLLSANEWMPSQPLRRGASYEWRVEAVVNGQSQSTPVPEGMHGVSFRILSAAEEKQLSDARDSMPGSHLLLGSVYQQLGMFDHARMEFLQLQQANLNSPLARRLLSHLQAEQLQQR